MKKTKQRRDYCLKHIFIKPFVYLIQNKYPELKLLKLWLQVNGFKYDPLFFSVENQNGI